MKEAPPRKPASSRRRRGWAYLPYLISASAAVFHMCQNVPVRGGGGGVVWCGVVWCGGPFLESPDALLRTVSVCMCVCLCVYCTLHEYRGPGEFGEQRRDQS